MAIEPVTAVTPEILAMSWISADAARTWFKRRNADPANLGLELKEYPSDKGLRVKVVPGPSEGQSAIDPSLFEDWASEVDGLLSAANEEPEADRALEDLFTRGVAVQAAFEEIVARRASALQAEVDGPFPTSEATVGHDINEDILPGEELAGTDDGTGPEPIEGGMVDLDEPAGGPVVAHEVYRTGTLSEAEQAHVDDALAKSMEPVGDGVALTSMPHPTTSLIPEPVFLADLLYDLDSIDRSSDQIIVKAAQAVRDRIQALGAIPSVVPEVPPPGPRPKRSERAEAIVGLLERPDGVTAKEVQALLGWENMPNPWHFRDWAKKWGRIQDLTDMGLVEGHRRWRLEVRHK